MALLSKKLIIILFGFIAGTLCVIKLALSANSAMGSKNENKSSLSSTNNNNNNNGKKKGGIYNFQQSYLQYNKSSTVYKIAVISDKDKDSKVVSNESKAKWTSDLMIGTLRRDPSTHKYSVSFQEKVNNTHTHIYIYT